MSDFTLSDEATAFSYSISGTLPPAITISGIVHIAQDGEVTFLNGHTPKEAAVAMWVALGGFIRQSSTAENVRLHAEIQRLNALLRDFQEK